jgi:preprotein translocase subunit SecD
MSSSYYLKITLGDTVLEPFDGHNATLSLTTFQKTIAVYTYSEAAAKQMVLQMTEGGIDYKYNAPERVEAVTTFLGANAEVVSCIAVAVIVLISMVALIVLYRGFGVASALSLLLFILLDVFMLVALPGIKVSIGGVIAIILSTIICVDGMVVIGNRIKEAGKTGKTVKASINAGFNGALVPIANVSVITLIVGLLFLAFASGPLYNFAVIITIGAVLSAITNLLFTRMFVSLFLPVVKNKEKFFNVNTMEV